MPRQPRLDGEGALHHVIVRGIERSAIFKDNRDRVLERIANVVDEGLRMGVDPHPRASRP